jgi:hypothetical protein
VLLLLLAPPFREAAATAGPGLLAAAGATWAFAATAAYRRAPDARRGLGALTGCLAIVGAAPALGAAATALVALALGRAGMKPRLLAIAGITLAALAGLLWLGAIGGWPTVAFDLGRVLVGGSRGAAAVLVGAGLLGIGFGALTGLPGARLLALALLVTLVEGALIEAPGDAPDLRLLALLAIAVAVIPAAIVRVVGAALSERRRALLALGAAVPLGLAAVLTGPALLVDDPGDAPTRLAQDLIGELPPGPGVMIATREASAGALQYERAVAGLRPDLAVAPLPTTRDGELRAVDALRTHRTAGSDVPAFGRLDLRRARPRGRGFELLAEPSPDVTPVPPPPDYGPEIGEAQAALVALGRARLEAALGHLDRAARAAGLTARFGAADLAVLAATQPTKDRPALFGFTPHLTPPGPWLLALFGDDLAWVAGISHPDLPADAPPERRLHARWRAIWAGAAATDPAIVALGRDAERATAQLLLELGRRPDAEAVARAGLARGDDATLALVLGTVLAERGGVGGEGAIDRDLLAEAQRLLDRAAALAPTQAEPLIWRGMVQFGLGDRDGAHASWLIADRLEPGRADLHDLLEPAP